MQHYAAGYQYLTFLVMDFRSLAVRDERKEHIASLCIDILDAGDRALLNEVSSLGRLTLRMMLLRS